MYVFGAKLGEPARPVRSGAGYGEASLESHNMAAGLDSGHDLRFLWALHRVLPVSSAVASSRLPFLLSDSNFHL